MKIINVIKQSAAALFLAAISFAGCKKNSGDDEPKAPAISMTTAMEGEVVIRLAGSGEAVIDWGDGSASETVTLLTHEGGTYFTDAHRHTHSFSGTTSRTIIVITGQNITHLYCRELKLTALDVSKNTALTWLDCFYNLLTNLDVSKNTALTRLECGYDELTSLDITKNTALTYLTCEFNDLTRLDVTKNTALARLVCFSNGLTDLDVSKNTALIHFNCASNDFTVLDVSKNTALKELNCGSNDSTSLDVSNNTALTTWIATIIC